MRMDKRLWQALESAEDDSGTWCVDIFVRPDGSFGFETFRRDPEDQGRWTILNRFAAARFATRAEACDAAAQAIPWTAGRLRA